MMALRRTASCRQAGRRTSQHTRVVALAMHLHPSSRCGARAGGRGEARVCGDFASIRGRRASRFASIRGRRMSALARTLSSNTWYPSLAAAAAATTTTTTTAAAAAAAAADTTTAGPYHHQQQQHHSSHPFATTHATSAAYCTRSSSSPCSTALRHGFDEHLGSRFVCQ